MMSPKLWPERECKQSGVFRAAWWCNFSSAVRNVEWFLSLSGTILKVAYFYISQLPLKVTMKSLAIWLDVNPSPCKVKVSDYHLWEMGISISNFLARGRERRDWIALSEQRWKARKRGRANKSFHLVSPSPSSSHLFEVRNSRAIQRGTGLENRLPGWMKSESKQCCYSADI